MSDQNHQAVRDVLADIYAARSPRATPTGTPGTVPSVHRPVGFGRTPSGWQVEAFHSCPEHL